MFPLLKFLRDLSHLLPYPTSYLLFLFLFGKQASRQTNKATKQSRIKRRKNTRNTHTHTNTSKQTKLVKTSSENLIYKKKDNNPRQNSQASNIRQKSTKVSLSSLCVNHLLLDMGPTLNYC